MFHTVCWRSRGNWSTALFAHDCGSAFLQGIKGSGFELRVLGKRWNEVVAQIIRIVRH